MINWQPKKTTSTDSDQYKNTNASIFDCSSCLFFWKTAPLSQEIESPLLNTQLLKK